MLGHELRNPLSPITTALELMKLRAGGQASREEQVIERQVKHLTRLVDDLLDVSKITRGKVELKREIVDVADVISRAVEIASVLFEQRGHRLLIEVPSEGLRLNGRSGAPCASDREPADQRRALHRCRRHGHTARAARGRARRDQRRRQRFRHRGRHAGSDFRTVRAGQAHAGSRAGRARPGPGAGQESGFAPRRRGRRSKRRPGSRQRVFDSLARLAGGHESPKLCHPSQRVAARRPARTC